MMKTTGLLMLMAFLCSGTAFAQSTTVKAEQRAVISAKSQKEASASSQLEVNQAGAASEMKDITKQEMNTAVEAGNHLTMEADQTAIRAAHSVKNTLNTSANLGGNLLRSTNLKIRPAAINTQIISHLRLQIR